MADTISKNSGALDLDYEALRTDALQLVQKLSGNLWTDFNIHDPGVTLLEEIVFAITELGYKTSFNIEDYLTSKENKIDYQREALFTAEQVRECFPVTREDYSEFFTKNMPSVSRVVFDECVDGFYSVRIVPQKEMEYFDKPEAEKVLLNHFAKLWNEWRNLGEEVRSINFDWNLVAFCEKPAIRVLPKSSINLLAMDTPQHRDFLDFSPIIEQFPTIYRTGANAKALRKFLKPVETLFKAFLKTLDDFAEIFSVSEIKTDYVSYNRILNQMLAIYGTRFPDELFRKIHGEREDSVSVDLLKSKSRYLQKLPELHMHRCGKRFRERIEMMLGVKTQVFDGIFFENGFGKVYIVWEHPERYTEDVRHEMEFFVREELPAHLIPLFYWVPKGVPDNCSNSWLEKNREYMSESLWI